MNLSQSNNNFFGKKDFLYIFIFIVIAIAIFYPIFYSEYLYTDEAPQLWLYKKGLNARTSVIPHGRYITDRLYQWLFGAANTIHDVIFIRLFSFFGWIIYIPLWYFIIKKIVTREKLPQLLTVFSILYLICTPPFTIYVSWASCLELFIANTAGLLSGYILYSALRHRNGKIYLSPIAMGGSALFGLISLFTYQSGFGCFLLPFLLHLISRPKNFRIIFIGIIGCLCIYMLYYFAFRYSLKINNFQADDRTSLSINIFPKVRFFLRPLASSFHFTLLFNESSIIGFVIYVISFFTWLTVDFYQFRIMPFVDRLKTFALTIFMLIMIYLPTLVVKENYFSNRTLFALNMGVFFLVANTLLTGIKKNTTRLTIVTMLSFLFVLNARYNFSQQFINPIKQEYQQLRAFIENSYVPGINTVYFIRPEEDFFVRKYGITRSWDEFGVPSSFFDWVPEFFVKQVIFEKTGDRAIAEKLTVKHWLGRKDFLKSAPQLSQNIMLVDAEEIMK